MTDEEFVVQDKRHFDQDGQVRDQEEEKPDQRGASRKSSGRADQNTCDGPPPMLEVTFPAFIVSLGTSALINMGEMPEPGSGNICTNLPLAKQTIDILAILKEKTKGNLTREEGDLLQNLLSDLRLKYVAALKR